MANVRMAKTERETALKQSEMECAAREELGIQVIKEYFEGQESPFKSVFEGNTSVYNILYCLTDEVSKVESSSKKYRYITFAKYLLKFGSEDSIAYEIYSLVKKAIKGKENLSDLERNTRQYFSDKF